MLIAAAPAAERRAIVAPSASYGFDRPHISKAPAGAKENRGSKAYFFRPWRGLNHFGAHCSSVRHPVADTKPAPEL